MGSLFHGHSSLGPPHLFDWAEKCQDHLQVETRSQVSIEWRLEEGRQESEMGHGVWKGLPLTVTVTPPWAPWVHPMDPERSLQSKPGQAWFVVLFFSFVLYLKKMNNGIAFSSEIRASLGGCSSLQRALLTWPTQGWRLHHGNSSRVKRAWEVSISFTAICSKFRQMWSPGQKINNNGEWNVLESKNNSKQLKHVFCYSSFQNSLLQQQTRCP